MNIGNFHNYVQGLACMNFGVSEKEIDICETAVTRSIERFRFLKSSIGRKYWADWNLERPNTLNSDHMASYLYLLSHEESNLGHKLQADMIAYLNKLRNGVDLWHEIKLPELFLLVHPIGTVLGRAQYGEALVVYQNVTVGSESGLYPHFDGPTVLYSGASVIGNCHIGENVVFGAGTLLVNQDIPPNSVVTGRTPHIIVRKSNFKVRSLFDATF